MKTHIPSNNEPSFCFIAPTEYLDQYATMSKTHLTLAHLVAKSEKYRNFYSTRKQFGDYIMMDNGAYEKHVPYEPSELLDLAKKSGASAIVLPDYPFQPAEKTINEAKKYISLFKDNGFDTFFVPQSRKNSLAEWADCYRWAADHPDIDIIGMSILGIPNAMPDIDPTYARVVITKMLIEHGDFNFNKRHHYLGLNSGPKLEIPSLIKMNSLTTIDSSGPIWAAICGHRYSEEYDSYQSVRKLKLPVDFNLPMVNDQTIHENIRHNCVMTIDLFDKTRQTSDVWYAKE